MTENQAARARSVRRVLWIVLGLNLAVAGVKVGVSAASGSLAVLADAFHSLVDASSNIIALVGVWAAARPADANHPYGHHKYETMATLGIGALLLIAAFEIGRDAVLRLFDPAPSPVVTPLIVALMAATFAVNVGVTLFETRAGKRHKSEVLLADAAHTRTDLFVTLSVVAALIGSQLGVAWLDPLVAAGVVVFLFRAAFGILQSSTGVLTDIAVANPEQVQDIARGVPGVTDVSDVRSRGRADAAYVDLNIRVNPAMDTDQAHAVASEVEYRIAEGIPGVVDTVVHIEPEWVGPPESPWEEIALTLRGAADGLGLGMHDLHAHFEPDGTVSVELHLEMASDLSLGEAHAVASHFEARAREMLPGLGQMVTHMEPLPTHLPGETGRLTTAQATSLRGHLITLADTIAGQGACHDVALHEIGGHITATLHVTQPADLSLHDAHIMAEAIERLLRSQVKSLTRMVVHVEPPE